MNLLQVLQLLSAKVKPNTVSDVDILLKHACMLYYSVDINGKCSFTNHTYVFVG